MNIREITERIIALVSEYFAVEKETVTRETLFFGDLPFDDSLEFVGFCAELEERLGVKISDDDIEQISTVGQIIDEVIRQLNSSGRAA
jgi:acyl carrier protein